MSVLKRWAVKSDARGKLKNKGGRVHGILRYARLRYLTLSWQIPKAVRKRDHRSL